MEVGDAIAGISVPATAVGVAVLGLHAEAKDTRIRLNTIKVCLMRILQYD
jgi:hypothetical protein